MTQIMVISCYLFSAANCKKGTLFTVLALWHPNIARNEYICLMACFHENIAYNCLLLSLANCNCLKINILYFFMHASMHVLYVLFSSEKTFSFQIAFPENAAYCDNWFRSGSSIWIKYILKNSGSFLNLHKKCII